MCFLRWQTNNANCTFPAANSFCSISTHFWPNSHLQFLLRQIANEVGPSTIFVYLRFRCNCRLSFMWQRLGTTSVTFPLRHLLLAQRMTFQPHSFIWQKVDDTRDKCHRALEIELESFSASVIIHQPIVFHLRLRLNISSPR